MKKINIFVLVFGSALLLFVYQNCQKAAFTLQEDSNESLSNPPLNFNYKTLEMAGSGGFRACVGRCLTSGKIFIDLEAAKITFKGNWMGGIEVSASDEVDRPVENPNLTDFTIDLNTVELEKFQANISDLKLTEHVIPACDPCFVVMDMPHVLHKLKDYNDLEKSVYLYDYIDPNINNVTVHAYATEAELNNVICRIMEKLESNLSSKTLYSDSKEIIKMVTHVNLNELSCF